MNWNHLILFYVYDNNFETGSISRYIFDCIIFNILTLYYIGQGLCKDIRYIKCTKYFRTRSIYKKVIKVSNRFL